MNTKLILTALSLSHSTAYADVPAQNVERDGRTWVRLSSDDPLILEMQARASDAGCVSRRQRIETRHAQVELVCDREAVVITQNVNWLGFRCSSLTGSACANLVLALTSDRRGTQLNAVGGSGWGI